MSLTLPIPLALIAGTVIAAEELVAMMTLVITGCEVQKKIAI